MMILGRGSFAPFRLGPHQSIADKFKVKFAEAVDQLQAGLPWQKGVAITPLPEPNKPAYIHELLSDAAKHGATIINTKGGATNGISAVCLCGISEVVERGCRGVRGFHKAARPRGVAVGCRLWGVARCRGL